MIFPFTTDWVHQPITVYSQTESKQFFNFWITPSPSLQKINFLTYGTLQMEPIQTESPHNFMKIREKRRFLFKTPWHSFCMKKKPFVNVLDPLYS